MSATVIQAQYEQLEELVQRFHAQADGSSQLLQNVRRHLDDLNGEWIGEGSQAFFREMEDEIFPALQRLTAAFEQSSDATSEIMRILQNAEEDAAQQMSVGDGSSRGSSSGGDVRGGGMLTLNLNQSEAIAAGIFNEAYMERFVGFEVPVNDPKGRLNALMEQLLHQSGTPQNTDSILDEIAIIRGVDPALLREQYQTYLQLLERGAQNNQDYPKIDLSLHPDWLGSPVSLRFGAVTGNVLGIDPVFGALLSPAGGLVGSGDAGYPPAPNDALGYHGVFHDAGGYLYNYQNIGPGYDYFNRELGPTSLFLSGQVSGIAWWVSHSELDFHLDLSQLGGKYIPDFLNGGVEEIEIPISQFVHDNAYLAEGYFDTVDGVKDIFRSGYVSIVDNIFLTPFGRGVF